MGKNKKNKKKGRKDSDSSTPQSSVPSVDDEKQQLLQRGACGTSHTTESKSPKKPTGISQRGVLEGESSLPGTSSQTARPDTPPEMSLLDVPAPESVASKPVSPSKGFFSQIIRKISPKRKSPNKLDSQCQCEDKNHHEPECPDWEKLKTHAAHDSPSRPSGMGYRVLEETAHSSSSSNPSVAEVSDNIQSQHAPENNRLSVPRNRAASTSPPRRPTLQSLVSSIVSTGRRRTNVYPILHCNCRDRNNHEKDCPEKVQEMELKYQDAIIIKSETSSSSASPKIIRKSEDNDGSNTSSSTSPLIIKRNKESDGSNTSSSTSPLIMRMKGSDASNTSSSASSKIIQKAKGSDGSNTSSTASSKIIHKTQGSDGSNTSSSASPKITSKTKGSDGSNTSSSASSKIIQKNKDSVGIDTSSSASSKIIQKTKGSDGSNTSSSVSPKIIQKTEGSDESNTTASADTKAEIASKLTEFYLQHRSFLELKEGGTPEERQIIIESSFGSLSKKFHRLHASRAHLENLPEAAEPDGENEPIIERMDESCSEDEYMNLKNGSRKRSKSFLSIFRFRKGRRNRSSRHLQRVKDDYDDRELELQGATGWSDPYIGKNKKLQRQDAIDFDEETDSKSHSPNNSEERRQRAQLAAAADKSDQSVVQMDQQIRSDTGEHLDATAAGSVPSTRLQISSTQKSESNIGTRLGARPKVRNVQAKESDVVFQPATALPGSDPSAKQSETKVPRNNENKASTQPSTARPKSDPSSIQSKPEVCKSYGSKGTTQRSTAPPTIPSKPEVSKMSGSKVTAQQSTARPKSDPSAAESKSEVARSSESIESAEFGTAPHALGPSDVENEPVVQATGESDKRKKPKLTEEETRLCEAAELDALSLRRHRSASPKGPRAFGACDCGSEYIHSIGCSREIRARRRRKLRRCKQDV